MINNNTTHTVSSTRITSFSDSMSRNCFMRISSGIMALSRAALTSASIAASFPMSICRTSCLLSSLFSVVAVVVSPFWSGLYSHDPGELLKDQYFLMFWINYIYSIICYINAWTQYYLWLHAWHKNMIRNTLHSNLFTSSQKQDCHTFITC